MTDSMKKAKPEGLIEVLRRQHLEVERVLVALERQLTIFEEGGSVDYELIEQVVAFCVDYLGLHHLATERPVLTALLDRKFVRDITVERIERECDRIAEGTRDLVIAVEAVFRDAEVTRQSVSEIGRRFIASCRRQIQIEEQVFFLAAIGNLKPGDWTDIATAISIDADSVLGDRLAESHLERYTKILKWDERELVEKR